MVAGLDRWREYFSEYKDKYVLIGGAVCNASMDSHFILPDKLKVDMAVFIQKVGDLPNSDFLKSAGLGGLNAEELFELLHKAFMV